MTHKIADTIDAAADKLSLAACRYRGRQINQDDLIEEVRTICGEAVAASREGMHKQKTPAMT